MLAYQTRRFVTASLLVPILSANSPFLTLSSYCRKIHFNSDTSRWSLSFRFPHQKPSMHLSPRVPHAPPISSSLIWCP